MRRVFMFLMLMQASVFCATSPNQLAINLVSDKSEYILGEPVVLRCTIENQGEVPLSVACDLSIPVTPCAFRVSGPIRQNCAEQRKGYEIGAYPAPPPLKSHETIALPPITGSDLGAVDAGEYEFWMEYDSVKLGAAPLRALLTPMHAESNRLRVRIVRPTGTDAEVLAARANACNQLALDEAALLTKFPTSTYAAYEVYRISGAEGMAASDPNKVAEAVTGGMGLKGEIWVPVAHGGDKNGLAPLTGKAAVEWREKWFDIVLKNHPGIWFADALRLKRATDQVALNNCQAGAADLENISQQAKPEIASKAKACLDLMRQKGWIKQ